MCRSWLIILIALAAVGLSAAPEYSLKHDREIPVYKCGEKAKTILSVMDNGRYVKSGKFNVRLALDWGRQLELVEVDLSENNPIEITATLQEPGFVSLNLQDFSGIEKPDPKIFLMAGMGFEPEKIKMAYDLPSDFMKFWEDGRKEIAAKPLQLIKDEKRSDGKQTTYRVIVDTLNSEKIYGYLAIPKGKGPFPVHINVPGAGPFGTAPNYSYVNAGAISLVMTVFKFDASDDPAELKKQYEEYNKEHGMYIFEGIDKRDTYFFRSVFLGIDKVVNHLANMPEWDGKHMVIDGASQGGGSSLILAGMNKNITAVGASIPGFCDLGGYKLGRGPGWPIVYLKKRNEASNATAPYFDAANFAKFIKVPAFVCAGFADQVCCPSSVYAAFNELKGEKIMIDMPLTGHFRNKNCEKLLHPWICKQLGLNRD